MRLIRARKELSQLFSKVIQARRASGVQEDDVLQVISSCALDVYYTAVDLAHIARAYLPYSLLLLQMVHKPLMRRAQVNMLTNVVVPSPCQVFINSKYRSVYGGRATTDEEITGFLIATLFAGQHTSSITSSWTGFFMLTNQV